ncbi:uncharacterized protein Pdf [Battus philenor]|uniref:uncharacterized protein Pdf n=1 Tax=Battus philenor TaxID=42288 RepID=UPI0035D0B73A
MRTAWRLWICVMIFTFLPEASVYNFKANAHFDPKFFDKEIIPYVTDEQYVRHIHSMVNAYSNQGDKGGRLVVETNALIDTKYHAWKRNVDLINSLLALPKGMNEAGR